MGAVRVGRVNGEFVLNPRLQVVEEEEHARPDRRRHGDADDDRGRRRGDPEEEILEAFEIAHAEIVKICDAQEDLRRQAGKPKYLDPEVTAELEAQHADRIRERIAAEGLREAAGAVEEPAGSHPS